MKDVVVCRVRYQKTKPFSYCIHFSLVMVSFFLQITTWKCFYHATLCVSAVFAVVRCLSVCPSVRLSRWCIVSAWRKILSNFLFCLVASSLRFLTPMRRYPIPRGTPSTEAQNRRGGKIWRFSTEIATYLGNGTSWAFGCYETSIGSHIRSIKG